MPNTGSTRLRVLFVQDTSDDASLIARKLAKGGYDVQPLRVDSPVALSQALQEEKWDLIISDFSLPVFSGFDALDMWRQMGCQAPFIFISGTLGEQAAVEALKRGASDYLLKDNLTRLVPAVNRALREKREREEREQERSQGEESLRRSEARFRALLEHSSDGILVLSQQGEVNFSMPGAALILGYSVDEFVGKSFWDLVDPGDRENLKKSLDDCLPSYVIDRTVSLRRKNNSWCVAECVFSNLLSEPAVAGIVVNYRDITDAALSQEALTKSEEKFSCAFRANPLPMSISTKQEGRYLDINDAFLEMFGRRRGEIIGRTSAELEVWAKPADRVRFLRNLEENHGRLTGYQATFKIKPRVIREIELAVEPIDLGNIPCLLKIVRDVTEIKRLEAQFHHSQKMEAVGQLAGGVAHDFNNLLMVMRSYAQMIEAQSPNSANHDYTKRIVEAADKAAGVTRQLLAFSRRQPQELKKLDLNRVVRDLCGMLPRLIGEDIDLRVSTDAPSGIVFADQGQLEQVLMNLAVNARDAMPTGGALTIETSEVDLGKDTLELPGAHIPPGRYVLVTVSDNGCGMSEDVKAQIFEPFFSTKGVEKGTGLGLATAYGIVKQHQGFICVYSEVGVGTTFKIYLPQQSGPSYNATSVQTGLSKQLTNAWETVLIVEDQAALLDVVAKYLTTEGYRILKARDGNSALKIVAAHVGVIHVLLTDVVMPGMRGPELAARLNKEHAETKVIYMSGYSETHLDGFDNAEVVHKPIDLGFLASKIRQVVSSAPNTRDSSIGAQ
jgi:two-component system cell cycle sensor histidine kinase/response regulator CckA